MRVSGDRAFIGRVWYCVGIERNSRFGVLVAKMLLTDAVALRDDLSAELTADGIQLLVPVKMRLDRTNVDSGNIGSINSRRNCNSTPTASKVIPSHLTNQQFLCIIEVVSWRADS